MYTSIILFVCCSCASSHMLAKTCSYEYCDAPSQSQIFPLNISLDTLLEVYSRSCNEAEIGYDCYRQNDYLGAHPCWKIHPSVNFEKCVLDNPGAERDVMVMAYVYNVKSEALCKECNCCLETHEVDLDKTPYGIRWFNVCYGKKLRCNIHIYMEIFALGKLMFKDDALRKYVLKQCKHLPDSAYVQPTPVEFAYTCLRNYDDCVRDYDIIVSGYTFQSQLESYI